MGRVGCIIDGRKTETWQGATILETALENKIYIPHLCFHPDLKPAGACRVCLVELDNGKLVTSCRTPVQEGMTISTHSDEVDRARRPVVEMIVANHHMDCRNCLKKGQCALQKIMAYMKIDKQKIRQNLRLPQSGLPVDDSNPFFQRDHNKCILCGLCVRTCHEIAKADAIDFAGRGIHTKISAFGDKAIAESSCVSCGECVIRCPVGALAVRNPAKPLQQIRSVCPHCGVGCGIYLGIRDHKIVHVKGDTANPVNYGNLCVKGRFGMGFVHSPDRLKNPLIRGKAGSGKGECTESSWDEALGLIARNLQKFRGDEFALIASVRFSNEDAYVAQKFARAVMSSNNIDTPARLYYGPNISAFRNTGQCVGFAPHTADENGFPGAAGHIPEQIEQAASVLVAGANITQSHPVLGLKILRAVEHGASLLVISTNETDLSLRAEKWLKPYPGTELAVIMGMCSVIVEEELSDRAFTEMYCSNFGEFRESVDEFSLGRVERISGVPRDLIEDAARIYASRKPAAVFWGSGITQYSHGTDNVRALINLAILTANIMHPLALNPLAEQSNALGACDMGCMPDYYPCYQPVGSPEIREKFESLWDCTLNPAPGLTLAEIFDATLAGKIKALYIIGADPASSLAPAKKVHAALKKAKFVVCQDMFLTETAKYAHVILPAASFAEKNGTIINTEGKAQSIRKALEPEGNSRADWAILSELATRMKHTGFAYGNDDDILSEVLSVIQIMPEQIGRFRLFPLRYASPAEVTDMDYPIILTTESDLCSSDIMSEKVEGLGTLRMKNCVEINQRDADDFEIPDGETIRIISRHGAIETDARISHGTPSGIAVIRMEQEKINQLMNPVRDEMSGTPEMKICAVRFEKGRRSRKRSGKSEVAARGA